MFSDPASISSITEDRTFNAGSEAELICEADANPITTSMVSWKRTDYDLGSDRVTSTSTDTSATLMVVNVTEADTGQFICEVSNGIGAKAMAPAYLIVKCKTTVYLYILCNIHSYMNYSLFASFLMQLLLR